MCRPSSLLPWMVSSGVCCVCMGVWCGLVWFVQTIILTLGLRLSKFTEDIVVLCGFFVVFLVLVYVILRFVVKERR